MHRMRGDDALTLGQNKHQPNHNLQEATEYPFRRRGQSGRSLPCPRGGLPEGMLVSIAFLAFRGCQMN